MKSRYALPVFLLAVATFWLSLLLTINLRRTTESFDGIDVPYTQVEGVDRLELVHSNENERHYSSSMYIRYADQPHITLKIRNLQNPETAIQQIFVREGSRLILQPKIHQQLDKEAANSQYDMDNEKWRITEMTLPIHINRLHTRGIKLNISEKDSDQKNEKTGLELPKLHVDTEDASIELDNIHMAVLNIRNRYIKESCTDKDNYSYRSGRIEIKKDAHVNQLFIESIYGHIELENSAAIKTMHLKTTPETSIELDRLDIYPRMRWEPLPTPPLPACKDEAEHMTAPPPPVKAQ